MNSDNQEITWRPQDADRESLKFSIRNRVRNAKVSEKTIFIPAKPKPSIYDGKQKKVAVYARVSTKSTEQVSSIENQTKYYNDKISKIPYWDHGGIFCDEGKTGTSTKKRPAFHQMRQAAYNKEIDLIICASVSRFARNVSDCIEEVRKLRTKNPSHPVGVYFETEDIYSLDPEASQRFKMQALFADWESENKSRRMILSYDQRICTGQYPVADLLGYRHTTDGNLIIQKEEAKTVKFIFLATALGYSFKEIAEILTQKQRPTLKGRTNWNEGMVRNITQNERRWGDLNARKTIVVDLVTRQTKKNEGERNSAYVPEHHEGIVTPELAKAVHFITSSNSKLEGGFSELSIIKQGALKGFISVSPFWNAIDSQLLYDICKSAYSDSEFIQLQHEVNILHGKEHSNIYSLQYTEYQVPYGIYFINNNTPTLTINQKQLKFNKKCHSKLGNCEYIEILYHPIMQTIILKATDKNSPTSFKCTTESNNFSNIITSPIFCNSLYENMDWIKDYSFKFRGILRERGQEKVLIFFLDEPRILVDKNSKVTEDDSPIQYIKYKNNDDSINKLGVDYSLRIKRDKIANSITESDLSISGEFVENPKIGKIPAKYEIRQELEELLKAM